MAANSLVLLLLVARGVLSSSDVRMCSQMYRYCLQDFAAGHEYGVEENVLRVEGRRGKAGPRGPPGSEGVVNYTQIDREILRRMKDAESRFEIKWEKYERRMNEMQIKMADSILPTGCDQVHKLNARSWNGTGGLFFIYPWPTKGPLGVYCDLVTDNGGWMVIQRRMDGSVDFFRNRDEYERGFGEMDKEFWIGLETLHRLTDKDTYELRVDLVDWDDNRAHAQYGTFAVGNKANDYPLTIGKYSGTAGDSLILHNGQRFSAKDLDLDAYAPGNCAKMYKGAWWHESCHYSNLNGMYIQNGQAPYGVGIVWYHWKGYEYSMKSSEMKIRKKH